MIHLPRWVTLSLWATAALVAGLVASWWWVTWPTRTIRTFAVLIEQGRFDEANRLMQPPTRWRFEEIDGRNEVRLEGAQLARAADVHVLLWQSWCSPENLDMDSRSIRDVVVGHQSFHFTGQYSPPFFIGGVAERGVVRFRCEPWAASY